MNPDYSMKTDWLRMVLADYAYPGIVLAVLLGLLGATVLLVASARTGPARTRRIVAAAVPVIVLVLLVPGASEQSAALARTLGSSSAWLLGVFGVVVGVGLVESARLLRKYDNEIAPSVYTLVLSALVSALVWALVFNAVTSLRWMLVIGIAAAGLDVVFLGIPRSPQPTDGRGRVKCPKCGTFVSTKGTKHGAPVVCGNCKFELESA